MNRKYLPLILVILVVVLLALRPQKSAAEGIRDGMVSAVDGVSTYGVRYTINVNISSSANAGLSDIQTIIGEGVVDVGNRKMFIDVRIRNPGEETENLAVYFIGDKAYLETDAGVIEQDIIDYDIIWETRTHLKQESSLLANADVVLAGEEILNGEEVYVLEVEPDVKRLVRYIAGQSIVGVDSAQISGERVDELVGMVKRMEITSWIAKEDYLPRKFLMNVLLDGNGILKETTIVVETYDYDKQVDIVPPANVTFVSSPML